MNDTNVFDFSTFPVLTTDRLTLRKILPNDAPDVFVFRGDREVQRYNGSLFQDVKEAQAFIEHLDAEYSTQAGINWGVTLKDNDTVLGCFSLHNWKKYHRRAEVGYDMARAYWGQGIATEALQAIVCFGFEQMNLNRIYAYTIADNQGSVLLLERVGFQHEGTERQYFWDDDGIFHDSKMYGLLRDEYMVVG